MAALDFPSSPAIGATYSANGKTWTWDGTTWLIASNLRGDMRWMGVHNPGIAYSFNDVTSFAGKTWVAGADVPAGPPYVRPPTAPWVDLAPTTIIAISDAATITWDLGLSPIAAVTITANRTVAAPTNVQAGGSYVLAVFQPPSGGPCTLTWNAMFKWPGGTAPVLSTAASALDVFTFIGGVNGVTLYGTVQKGFA